MSSRKWRPSCLGLNVLRMYKMTGAEIGWLHNGDFNISLLEITLLAV